MVICSLLNTAIDFTYSMKVFWTNIPGAVNLVYYKHIEKTVFYSEITYEKISHFNQVI
jgi:hypothetical protein